MTPPHPQFGPLFAEGAIDPEKGGSVKATRAGRTYEVSFPPGAVEAETTVTVAVTEYEGGAPAEFRLEGRIVSNRVDIQPEGLVLLAPVKLSVAHFCADADGGKSMYMAQLNETIAEQEEEEEEGEQAGAEEEEEEKRHKSGFRVLEGGKFSTGTGFATNEV